MSYRTDVDTILATLRSIAQSIPGYEYPPAGAIRRLVRAKGVPIKCVIAAGVAVEAHERLARASEVQSEPLHDGIEYCYAYGDLEMELTVMLRGVQYALAKKRAELGDQALRVLRLADELNKWDKDQQVIPHVQTMREALHPRRRRKGAKEQEEEDVPPSV